MSSRSKAQRLHRWAGIAIAIFVFIAGVTGAAITFYDEADAWLNRDSLRVTPRGAVLSLASLISTIEARYPDATVRSFYKGEEANLAWVFNLRPRGKSALLFDQVFVDPHDGSVRAERKTDALGTGAQLLMPSLLRLHRSMLLGEFGNTLMGCVALTWLLSSLLGLYLAWPASGSWRSALRVKLDASPTRRRLDFHRVVGIASSMVLLAVSLSAVYLAFPDLFRSAVRLVSATGEATRVQPSSSPIELPITHEQAMQLATSQYPGSVARGIVFMADKGFDQVRVRLQGDINLHKGTGRVSVDMRTGAVLASQSFRSSGAAGDTFIAWMFPLHSGQAFGTIGRVVVGLMGLVAAFMAYTGTRVWWVRRQAIKRGRERASSLRKQAVTP